VTSQFSDQCVRQAIRIFAQGNVAKWAKKHGFTQSYISKVLRGEREVSDQVAQAAGFRRKVYFVPCKEEDNAA
jgi:hypothetical protein